MSRKAQRSSSVPTILTISLCLLWSVSVEGFTVPRPRNACLRCVHRLQVTNGQDGEMSAQERVLRNAGLWDEKAQSEKAEKARIAVEEQNKQALRNVLVAVVSIGLAIGNYFWAYTRSVSLASSVPPTPVSQQIVSTTTPTTERNESPLDAAAARVASREPEQSVPLAETTSEIAGDQPAQQTAAARLPYSQAQTSVPPLQLLARMTEESDPISIIGTNGKPTVVDFWAPWCENCKLAAPTLSKVEAEYKGRVNFVMIDCDGTSNARSWAYIKAFGVDAIPHLALVSADGDVETALIGPVPKSVLEADFNTLIDNANGGGEKKELPYTMLDVFANKPEKRRVSFQD